MYNILITQKVFSDKYNQMNWSLENNWFKFFKEKKVNLIPLGPFSGNEKKLLSLKPKGIIFSGGNDLHNISKSKENLARDRFEKKILKFSIKNKIPILAVCRGFQLVAKFFKSTIVKKENHVRTSHILNVDNRALGFKIDKIKVNSYHNYTIHNLPNFFNLIIRCSDNSIEIAKSNRYKILSFMFHPERANVSQKKINKIVFSHFKIK